MSDLRSSIIEMLREELVGPSRQLPAVQSGIDAPELRNEEMLRAEDPPRVRYGAGILFPGGARVEAQDDIDESAAPSQNMESDIAEVAEAAPDQDTTEKADEDATIDRVTDLEVNRANEYLPSALG